MKEYTAPKQEITDKEPDTTSEVPAVSDKKAEGQPVFKVQIIASPKKLSSTSPHLKGLENVDFYEEGEYFKYTYGASTDYNEIYRLRKTILDKFPQAFIIAFKNGEKMNVNQAIREFKSNRR